MRAARALASLRSRTADVELIATDTVKAGLAALHLKEAVISAIIIEPDRQKKQPYEHTKEHGACSKIKHGCEKVSR